MAVDPRTPVPTDHVFAIPSEVAACPYCGGALEARAIGWTEVEPGSRRWEADSIEVDCTAEPDIDDEDDGEPSPEWEEWDERHSEMPYVYWLPMTGIVERWVNERFRFEVD